MPPRMTRPNSPRCAPRSRPGTSRAHSPISKPQSHTLLLERTDAMSVHHLEPAAALLGRLLLSAIFLHEAWAKLTGYAITIAYMQAFGVPGVLLRHRRRTRLRP